MTLAKPRLTICGLVLTQRFRVVVRLPVGWRRSGVVAAISLLHVVVKNRCALSSRTQLIIVATRVLAVTTPDVCGTFCVILRMLALLLCKVCGKTDYDTLSTCIWRL